MNILGRNRHPLSTTAQEIRLSVLDMINTASGGHIGGSLSSVEIMVALYFSDIFNFDRDHFILSAGHLCPTLYAVLAKIGKIPERDLSAFADIDSRLEGHVSINVPGVEYSSGSLGQGLSFAAGLALGDKLHHTLCLTTDGEHDEGQIWEAIMFANKYHQGNLINIVDYNGQQIGGSTADIMPLGELASKYLHFGWTVQTINGHDLFALIKALKIAKSSTIFPAAIIAKTVMGKGISFMENDYHYHDIKKITPNLYLQAKSELENNTH
jgi:transketolase